MPTPLKRKRLFGMGVLLTMLISMTIFGAMTQIVSAADTIGTSQYLDTNGNGTVDTIRWTMDENVTACAYEAGDWSIGAAGTINVTAITGLTCTGTDAILDISVTTTGSITGGAVNPVISYANVGTGGSVTLTSGAMTVKPGIAATDGAAPQIANATSTTPDNTYGPGIAINISLTFTEAVSSAGLTINLDTVAGLSTGVLTTQSSFAGNIYTVGVTGSGENTTDLTISSISGTMTDGITPTINPVVPIGFNIADNKAIGVDTTAPSVVSITTNYNVLTDANVGTGTFTVTVVYDETMDATVPNNPTVGFNLLPAGLSSNNGGWTMTGITDDTYIYTLDLADNNETFTDIDIDVTLGKDLSGNTQNAGSAVDAFDLDTQNPTITNANISIAGGSGPFGEYIVGDTVTVTWDSASEPNTDVNPSTVLADLSGWGLIGAVAMEDDGAGGSCNDGAAADDVYCISYTITGGEGIDAINVNPTITATDNVGNTTGPVADGTNATVDTLTPILNAGSLIIDNTGCTGTSGICIVGDTILFQWDNTATGDNNGDEDPTQVLADLTNFGGGAAQLLYDDGTNGDTGVGDELYMYGYTVTAGTNDGTNTYDLTVTDDAGNVTGPVTSLDMGAVDNEAPAVSAVCISVMGDSGTGGAFKYLDTPSPLWDNSAGCDNNADTIAQVDFDASDFRAVDSTLPGVDSASVWSPTLTGLMDAQDDINNNVSVTAYDDAGNSTTRDGTNNYIVDTELPSFTAVNTVEALKQDGTAPTLSTNIWYYYTGQNLRIQLNYAPETDGNDLAAVKGCMRSMNEHSSSQTCDTTEFATDPTKYQDLTVNAGLDTATLNYALAGLPLGLPTITDGYIMNFELTDDVGNVWASAAANQHFHGVFAVDPKVMYTGTPDINNATTTDWSTITDFTNVTNLVFNANDGVNDVGRLTITGPLDLTSLATIDELSNLNANMIVTGDQGDGSIDVKIDSADLSIFDTGATVMIRVPTAVQPGIVVRDDADVIAGYIASGAATGSAGGDNLTAITWDGLAQTLTFNTDGFTSFGTDQTAPTATISPVNGATGVATTAATTVTFNEEMNTATFTYTLTPDPGGTSVTWNGTNTIATIAHNAYLNSTAYTLTVTGGDDTSGNTTAGATSTFTTVAAGGGGGGGGGSAGGSGTPYVAPSTTTAEEEAAAEEAAAEEEATTEEPALSEATEEEMAAAEEAFTDITFHWAAQYIARVYADGYIQGYEDQTFKPDQEITRAEASKLIAMWLNGNLTDADCDGTLFSDVTCDNWYGKFVSYLRIREIIMGYEDGTFGPDKSITRAEALKIMIYAKLLQGTDISGIVNPFTDVSAREWFHNVVMIAYKLSIVEGFEDGTFGPNNSITRAEFTKIFVETLLNN